MSGTTTALVVAGVAAAAAGVYFLVLRPQSTAAPGGPALIIPPPPSHPGTVPAGSPATTVENFIQGKTGVPVAAIGAAAQRSPLWLKLAVPAVGATAIVQSVVTHPVDTAKAVIKTTSNFFSGDPNGVQGQFGAAARQTFGNTTAGDRTGVVVGGAF